MSVPEGREVLLELARWSDVFLTSFPARAPAEVRHRRRRHPGGQSDDHLRAARPRGQESGKGGLRRRRWCRVAPPPPSPRPSTAWSPPGDGRRPRSPAPTCRRYRRGAGSARAPASVGGRRCWRTAGRSRWTNHPQQHRQPPGVHGSPINPSRRRLPDQGRPVHLVGDGANRRFWPTCAATSTAPT